MCAFRAKTCGSYKVLGFPPYLNAYIPLEYHEDRLLQGRSYLTRIKTIFFYNTFPMCVNILCITYSHHISRTEHQPLLLVTVPFVPVLFVYEVSLRSAGKGPLFFMSLAHDPYDAIFYLTYFVESVIHKIATRKGKKRRTTSTWRLHCHSLSRLLLLMVYCHNICL